MIPPDMKEKYKSLIIHKNMVKSMGLMNMVKSHLRDLKSLGE